MLRGLLAAILYLLNLFFWPIIVFIGAVLRHIPIPGWQSFWQHMVRDAVMYWFDGNNFIQRLTSRVEWDLRGLENLKRDDWYLLVSNHVSGTDILVLGQAFNRRSSPTKFFLKKELLWTLPLAGFAAKLAYFPFMERHSKSYLAKHPELKGKDLETTRKSCEIFKTIPTTMINFAESTRFSVEKHAQQASPYKHLLRPRAGGLAFALGAMGESFHKLLNVTIIYPEGKNSIWDYFCGRIKKIIVHVELLPITDDLVNDYENNREFRVYFQQWLNNLWRRKDELIEEILKENKY